VIGETKVDCPKAKKLAKRDASVVEKRRDSPSDVDVNWYVEYRQVP
jgi:hypothetical protein